MRRSGRCTPRRAARSATTVIRSAMVPAACGTALPCATATRTPSGPCVAAGLIGDSCSAGTSWRSYGNAIARRSRPAVRGPPRRSTGSRTGRPGCSCEVLLASPGGPGGEALARLARRLEPVEHPLHVAGQVLGGRLEAAQLAAEPGAGAVAAGQGAAQVHLEPLDLGAVRAGDQAPLQADVGSLDPGAGVRAAVEVDRDRHLEPGQPPLQLADQVSGPGLGLGDRQLAEFDPGAGHRVPAEYRRP